MGIDRNANEDQIKAAFKKRSRKYHPDRNKKDPRAKQKFSQVVNAYELLKDPEKRRIYDQTGGADPNEFQQGGFQQGGFQQGGFPNGGFGFPNGGFGFPNGGGFGINIEDLLRNQGFQQQGGHPGGGFHRGHPGGYQQYHQQGHPGNRRKEPRKEQRHSGKSRQGTYSFSFGGQPGANYEF